MKSTSARKHTKIKKINIKTTNKTKKKFKLSKKITRNEM